MGNFFDLHRHDEASFFDGFGKPIDLAIRAKELGYTALGTSNHGNISGIVQHWLACKEVGIKPILGCEVYFQPKYNKKSPQRKSYHLCLFVKNLKGYENLCHILTEANEKQFYYKAIVDFKLLEKYSEGIICTTACIASATSQAIIAGNSEMAGKLLDKLKSIFGEDLYAEIQPYRIDDKMTQETTDYELMKLARKRKIKCILTSDSHYCRKEDFDTYIKMHKIGKTTLDVEKTYGERYMPSEYEIAERFCETYKTRFKNPMQVAERFIDNLKRLQDSVDDEILEKCELVLPKISETEDSEKKLKQMVKDGLKKRGKFKKEYIDRCKMELDVIHYHGFDDYFLMVQEYVNWARDNGIAVGPGRGSACNCEVAYAIGITDVDSLKYKLDFSRFMRKDKKKLPDIDVDFETEKRQLVIDHVIEKYAGRAVQICSYGEYKVDNLVNDLAGVCGLETTGKDIDEWDKQENKKKISEIKSFIKSFDEEGKIMLDKLKDDERFEIYNSQYDNIMKHFVKMYGKIRQLGKHAAGVAVVGSDISNYTCRVRKGDMFSSAYDLNDLEHINCTKFDMLGLKTMSELKELEYHTKHVVTEEEMEQQEIYDNFREGNTEGIFQMEKSAPKKILDMIQCDCMEDVIAVNALNRPAPLQMKMHETYARNKLSEDINRDSPFYQYTKETYGTMLYQEQTVEVAQKIGHLSSQQSFDLLKIMKKAENLNKPEYVPIIEEMKKDFFKGCKKEGLTKEETKSLWESMLIYGFNKGHSTGYAFISVKQMWYKINYPTDFWYVKMKYAPTDADGFRYTHSAVKDGALVVLPHVNYSAFTSLRKMEGEKVIQQGLNTTKGIGDVAAKAIEEERKANGAFRDYDDFYDRCIGGAVTKRVISILEEQGALEFNRKKFYSRVVKYNSTLLAR